MESPGAIGREAEATGVKRPPLRRTQSERSASTRGRLIDAAIECLCDLGYAGATTGAIVERAGLSRGALLHHFRTRDALMREVGVEISRRLEALFFEMVAELPSEASFKDVFIIGRRQIQTREFRANAVLQTATRADPTAGPFFAELQSRYEAQSKVRLTERAVRAGIKPGRRLDAFLDLVAVVGGGFLIQMGLPDGRRKIDAAVQQLSDIAEVLFPSGDTGKA
ncbi:MAG TPA: TetR/AcrR family transcriptional regulator [Caulobacteraceae bacterium]|nr:TetR/AcrR family transcriptional regulator [Caulobacteraceae bacterium]